MGEKEGQKDLSATLGHPEVSNTHGNMDREDFGQYNHRKKDLSVTLGHPEVSITCGGTEQEGLEQDSHHGKDLSATHDHPEVSNKQEDVGGQRDLSSTLDHPEVPDTCGGEGQEEMGQDSHHQKDLSTPRGHI